MSAINRVAGPAAEPISLTEAKAHLRVTDSNSDTLITALIPVAREWCESWTHRSFVLQMLDWTLDKFQSEFTVPLPPLRALDSLKYTDLNGTQQTLATSIYTVDKASEPARVVEAYLQSWPDSRGTINDIVMRIRAGYITPFTADASTDVITAVNHTYANGDTLELTNSGGALPAGLATKTIYYARDVSGNTLKLAATSGGTAIDITGTGTGTHFLGELPAGMRHAMLLLLGELYERRETSIVGAPIAEVPFSVRALLGPYRLIQL